MLNPRNSSIRYQNLLYVDKICGQNVTSILLSILSIPGVEVKIHGDVIDVKYVMIKYPPGKENTSSTNGRAAHQQYKFLYVKDKRKQNFSSGSNILAIDENYNVVVDNVMDEKANAVKKTKVRFSMYCRSAIEFSNADGFKRVKAFDSIAYSGLKRL